MIKITPVSPKPTARLQSKQIVITVMMMYIDVLTIDYTVGVSDIFRTFPQRLDVFHNISTKSHELGVGF